VELAAAFGAAQPGGLTMAAISAVFTIGYVANLLGEDADSDGSRPGFRDDLARHSDLMSLGIPR
jgi:hypothetical protein